MSKHLEHWPVRPPAERARRARAVWGAVVVVMLVAAVLLAVAIVGRTASLAHEEARRDFGEAAAEVEAAVRLDIQRQDDLAVSLAAHAATHPTMTNGQLRGWLDSVRAEDRYPDLAGVGFIRIVEPGDLDAYIDGLRSDPSVEAPSGAGVDPMDLVLPPGPRDRYCFMQAATYLTIEPVDVGPLLDVCTDPSIAAVVDSVGPAGDLSYQMSISVDGDTPFLVTAPSVGTSEDGTDQLLGGIAAHVDMDGVLQRALEAHPGITGALHHDASDVDIAVVGGGTADAEDPVEIALVPGWTLSVAQTSSVGGIGAGDLATPGVALIAALASAFLVYVLGTGRARALELVDNATEELQHQALHDSLTGLPNRALIADRAEALIKRCRRAGTMPAAMFVDIDGFKDVNDSLGHEVGDQLLCAVSSRLTGALRGTDTIGRLGGDEFIILLDGSALAADPGLVADRMLVAMDDPFMVGDDDVPVRVTASIGIAVGDRPTHVDLLRDADVALYEAKAAGRNCWRAFDSGHESNVLRRTEVEFELRKLVPDEALRLVYQPIFDLEGLTVVDVEALLRWDHSTLGEISPGEFIPLLERSGRIGEVGAWVLEQACTQLAQWRADGMDIGMAVNVSARQLDDEGFVERVASILGRTGIPPHHLTLEVTETALMADPARAAAILTALKRLGTRIAIDDFGTGYSSLAYLQRFPVDILKIDRMFINALDGTAEPTALVRTLVDLGRQLGLRTLAEGVETVDQMERLRANLVDMMQGFLLARPMHPDAVREEVLGPRSDARKTDVSS